MKTITKSIPNVLLSILLGLIPAMFFQLLETETNNEVINTISLILWAVSSILVFKALSAKV